MTHRTGARSGAGIGAALSLFVIWTAATWFFEGRIETLLRPEAAVDRILYAIIANLLVGIAGAVYVIRWLHRSGSLALANAGFGLPFRPLIGIVAGALLGFALYAAQGASSLDPIVMLNMFAQVLVVSIAEVLVCWSAVGSAIEASLLDRGRLLASATAAIAASVLFGLYHFAHSPPFNSVGMVLLLSMVGLMTSLFFFISRDVYGTIVFHNFSAMYGVAQALKGAGKLDTMGTPHGSLLATAAIAIAVLIATDRLWLRTPRG
jgi:hypothetical protein